MNKLLIVILFLTSLNMQTLANSGRTDSNGGHNCSQSSKDKGLCTGYHYHNDGGFRSDLQTETSVPLKLNVKMILEPGLFHTHGDEPAHKHPVQKK